MQRKFATRPAPQGAGGANCLATRTTPPTFLLLPCRPGGGADNTQACHRPEPRCPMFRLLCSALALTLLLTHSPAAEDKAKPLFDGKTLAGWEGDTKNTWRVEDGAI